ncbi:MAG: Maf family protein [Lachnospiraceae bacterium]
MTPNIILASASPRRKELLYQIGLEPKIIPSHVEEVITSTHPEAVVKELSEQKAADIAAQYHNHDAVIIGADTVVAIDDQILGKPADHEQAVFMLNMLQGRNHQVYTGVTIINCQTGNHITFAEKTEVEVYPMTKAQIKNYVETGDPMDKAGAYGIQGQFAAHIKGIKGDYNNVVGLPVGRLYQELQHL